MNDTYYVKRNPELIDRKVIEDIKAEIEKQKINNKCFDDMFEYITGLNDALDIINKHIGGDDNEQTD